MATIDVKLRANAYTISITPGGLAQTGELCAEVVEPGVALVAIDENVIEPHGAIVQRALGDAGFRVVVVPLVAEERVKTLETVQRLYTAMLAGDLDRTSLVIAFGGGCVGDIAGYAAASYLRGIPFVQVPTTLLAMVDAAIGGKTGVNFPLPASGAEASVLGKNLIGAFWQPRLVLADPAVLRTLPIRELRCGLAESVKHAIIADVSLLGDIERDLPAILGGDVDALAKLITRSAAIKVDVVTEDEREMGRRAVLNLGHTFAHVIEPRAHLGLRHGEAVAIGLVAAMRLAVEMGRIDDADESRVAALLQTIGLPTRLPGPEPVGPLVTAMGYDKKVAGGQWRLVVTRALGEVEIVTEPPRAAVEAAWRCVGAA